MVFLGDIIKQRLITAISHTALMEPCLRQTTNNWRASTFSQRGLWMLAAEKQWRVLPVKRKRLASGFSLFSPSQGHRICSTLTVPAASVPCCPPTQPPPSVRWHSPLPPTQDRPRVLTPSHWTHGGRKCVPALVSVQSQSDETFAVELKCPAHCCSVIIWGIKFQVTHLSGVLNPWGDTEGKEPWEEMFHLIAYDTNKRCWHLVGQTYPKQSNIVIIGESIYQPQISLYGFYKWVQTTI